MSVLSCPVPGFSRLELGFFARPTVEVARELLGKLLVCRAGEETRVARLVETEAYLGQDDLASHARFGPTPRASLMFGPAGVAYVYLIYGIHHCLNVVTEEEGHAGAVLLRAARPWPDSEPSSAQATSAQATSSVRLAPSHRPYAGPGKLCAGLGITRRHNGLALEGEELYLGSDGSPPPRIKASARVGVAYAGRWANRRLRFFVPGDPHVSGKPRR